MYVVRVRHQAQGMDTTCVGLWCGLPRNRLLRKLVLFVRDAHLLLHLPWAVRAALIEEAEDAPVLLS